MERLPRRTPAAQMDIVGLVFDALATMVEDIPIIGDIVGFVASLFGNSSASNARIARLETIVSKGSSGYDDFNRADTSSLGRGPQMTADWVTGGNGQALGVQGRAAGLVEAALPADGRRWARYPTPASSSTMTADTIVDDKKVDNRACTSVIVAANAAFTEFVYANVFGTGVYLGRGTRSGNSWSFTDWKSNTSYKVGTAERVEVRASGSGIYQLVVDNTVILEHTDTTYPIDVDHRYVGFAIQCWTGILQLPEYGWRLSAFSLKSEAGTFTAIETVETIANGAQTTANGAQTAAENAVGTAVTEATAAAVGAVGTVIAPLEARVSALEGGGTRTVYSSNFTWTNPGNGTIGVAVFNGGQCGELGRFTNNSDIMSGGNHGGYAYKELRCADLPATVAGTVGAGGATNLQLGGQSSFGSYVVPISGAAGSILTKQGAVASNSTPGRGGNAGVGGVATPGVAGESTALAAGGAGGVSGPGGDGGSVPLDSDVPCGGGGGGGGAGRNAFSVSPWPGGAGGAPGGGGGAGGKAGTSNPAATAAPGPAGNGRIILTFTPGAST